MTPPVPDDVLADNVRVLASLGGNQSKAADVLNISRSALQHRVRAAHRRGIFPPEQPEPVIEVEIPRRETFDADFWRRKHSAIEKQLAEAEHLVEQLSGLRAIDYQIPEWIIDTRHTVLGKSVIGCLLSDTEVKETVRVYLACGRNATETARLRNLPRTRINHHLHIARERNLIPPVEPEPVIEVEIPQRPVVRVRAYNPLNAPDAPSRRVVFFSDTHVKPGMAFQHFKWIGRYVTENRPDNVVHPGDFLECESCEFHTAPGSATHSRRPSFAEDIESGVEALEAYHAEIPIGEIPHDIIYGNHEFRIWRYEEAAPNLKDVLTLQLEQMFARYRWRSTPYRQWLFLEGVGITHVPHTIMQKPIGGRYPENTIGNQSTHSVIFGHTHRYNHLTVPKIGVNNSITVTNVGCAMPYGYTPPYADGATTGLTYGIVDMTLRAGRVESSNFISMLDLQRRYGK